MLLMYQTLSLESEENCLPLGDNIAMPTKWADIRLRTHGLIPKHDPVFIWNGSEWESVSSDAHVIKHADCAGTVLRVRLLPSNTGAQFPARKAAVIATKQPKQQQQPAAKPQPQQLDETIHQVSDSIKNTFSIFAKQALSATDLVAKAVNEGAASLGEKRSPEQQIGGIRFRLGKKIAEGGFSEVFLAKEEGAEQRQLAIKKCLAQTPEQLDQLKKEIQAHSLFTESPYILQLLGSEVARSQVDGRGGIHQVRFVFPLCAGGSWFDAVKTDEEHIKRIFLGAAKALQHMHAKRILHRDVKPHNILLTAEGHPLVMDLGSSCEFPIVVQSKRQASDLQEDAAQNCSAPYRAPELFDPQVGKTVGAEADVWSLGCTLFAVLWGKGYSPYEDSVQGVLKLAILNGSKVKFPAGSSNNTALRQLAQHIVLKSVVHGERMSLEEMIKLVESAG